MRPKSGRLGHTLPFDFEDEEAIPRRGALQATSAISSVPGTTVCTRLAGLYRSGFDVQCCLWTERKPFLYAFLLDVLKRTGSGITIDSARAAR